MFGNIINQIKELQVRMMGGDAPTLKDTAAQLAAVFRVQAEKGWDEWSQLHGNLAEVAAAAAFDQPEEGVQTLLKLATDASSSQALMRALKETLPKANPGLLKDLVLLVAHELNMTPLGDSYPVQLVDGASHFCDSNVNRIIKGSAELSAPNALYAVISIVGPTGIGKSHLLNRLFGTKFPVMDRFSGRYQSARGIMISRCIGPSLLLLDFEGFNCAERERAEDISDEQAILFALEVSDLIMVNLTIFDIGREQGSATYFFRIIFQERAKLHLAVFTKILVVLRMYNGETPIEIVRSDVMTSLEKIWKSVNKGSLKFTDCIEVNIVGLPDMNSREFPKEVAALRKLLSNNITAKVPASRFCLSSSMSWNAIKQNKKLDIHQLVEDTLNSLNFFALLHGTCILAYSEMPESPFMFLDDINNFIKMDLENQLSLPRVASPPGLCQFFLIVLPGAKPIAITFQELHHITDGFSRNKLLGTGGYGRVYKGVFDNGEAIAVKKLHNNPGLVEEQFRNELLNLMTVQHQNIIRLVGYCSEAQQILEEHEGKNVLLYQEERALCLEYMEGGNLEKLLSDESCGLDWEARYKIIKGICHGLKHLHTGSKDPIYHLDLKPANILLDKHGIPKIGDFGLSTLLASTGTFVTEKNSGTPGYMPPEYIVGHEVSQKFDVFSLGVIMIEVMAGKNAYNNYKSDFIPSQEFIDQVSGNWRKREQAEPMSTEALMEVEKCIKVALRCVEDNRANRPTITELVEELDMTDHHRPADARDERPLQLYP